METAKPARSIEKVVDLETFLVEWKHHGRDNVTISRGDLETFLVEWKLLERVEPDRVGVLP